MERHSPTISKNRVLPPGLDFFGLRAEGIQLLQGLSSDAWTDYNDHDPGVTILEALCYALTDLSNRAEQPIPDLLARPPGTAPRPDSTMVPAPQAFANHPVTFNDYRKLLLGDAQFRKDLRNVWIKPNRKKNAMTGEFVVRVGLHYGSQVLSGAADQAPPQPLLTLPSPEALAQLLLRTLNDHRNLGEQFVGVTFLQPYFLAIGGRLDLQGAQLPEDFLADVLWAAYNLLQPSVPRYDLADWPSLSGATEEVLAGPLPATDLLLESDLAPQLRQLGAARLHAELSSLPGVHRLDGLGLYEPGQSAPVALVRVGPEQEFLLDVETSLTRLTVSQKGMLLNLNLVQVRNKFEQRRAENQRPHTTPTAPPHARVETGRYLSLSHYDSIQHSFPAVYGLGPGGLPATASPFQHAHTLQLKGYLVFFEQLMANFCAQLSNVEALLSAQPVEPELFSQVPADIPDFHLLLDTQPRPLGLRAESTATATEAATDTRADKPQSQLPENPATSPVAYSYLQELAEDPDALRQRRDVLLTHLLARFGYVIAPYHPAPNDPDDIARHSLAVREHLLQQLNTVTYFRGAAQVDPNNAPFDVAGLELFLYLLTGIRYFQFVAQHEQLAMLEQEVCLPQGLANPSTKLLVHGTELDFPAFLDLLQQLLKVPCPLAPHPTPTGRLAVTDATGQALELELTTVDTASVDNAAQQVMHYLRQLDERQNRFILLDHCTLKPADTDPPATTAPDYGLYEFQISICLPAFTRYFQPLPGAAGNEPTTEYREYLQNLILTHAPAHLLVHMVWLDYPQMKELESKYEQFVASGGLRLSDDGRDPAKLLESQQRLTEFLRPHLSL